MNLIFHVPGTPIPEGSTRAWVVNGHPVTTHANAKALGPWRSAIAEEARKAAIGQTFSDNEAVYVRAHFAFLRPKSRAKQVEHTTKPDLDKLLRALLDALKGIAYTDDSHVIDADVSKVYVDANPGVDVHVLTQPIHKRPLP